MTRSAELILTWFLTGILVYTSFPQQYLIAYGLFTGLAFYVWVEIRVRQEEREDQDRIEQAAFDRGLSKGTEWCISEVIINDTTLTEYSLHHNYPYTRKGYIKAIKQMRGECYGTE